MTNQHSAPSTPRPLPTWDEIVDQLQQLQARGFEQRGKWDLEQTARHLNDWLSFLMDGFPDPPMLLKPVLVLLRLFLGKRWLKEILEKQAMRRGSSTLPSTVHASTGKSGEAIQQLLGTIERFRGYKGPIHRSPLFGSLDKPTADRLQRIHFAHHLSFLTVQPS